MEKIKLESKIINDKYTEYIYDSYDIQNRDKTEITIPYDLEDAKHFKWNIGVIYGNSGSGKTTILKKLGKITECSFDPDKPLISNFDWLEPKDATMLLTSIGLSSVPTWLRPFKLLSNGEQYRAELAYKVGKENGNKVILVDEYTSVVDRDVAKAMSFALQKYVRKNNKRIVLSSCHSDIMEWLMPDWTCSPQKGGALERGDWLRQGRPKIELQVSRTESGTWDFFKKHHYLTENCSKGFAHLLFEWNNKPVGICVYKAQPTGAVPNGYGLSRVVVLPDFQGMGIGSKISEFTAGLMINNGKRFFIKTVNPALGEYMDNSDKFRPTAKNRKIRKDTHTDNRAKRLSRASYCYEYIGEAISGYEELTLPIKEMRNGKN